MNLGQQRLTSLNELIYKILYMRVYSVYATMLGVIENRVVCMISDLRS